MKSKTVAVSAIAAALTAVFLTIGAYLEIVDVFAIIIGSIFPILPLYFKSYKGSVLSFLCGGTIAFICSGFNIISLVFPAYFAFFGVYPIVKSKLLDKSFNKVVGFFIGLVWFLIVAYGLYFYFIFIMNGIFEGVPFWFTEYIIYFVGLFAIVFYVVYDRFVIVVRKVADFYMGKILK